MASLMQLTLKRSRNARKSSQKIQKRNMYGFHRRLFYFSVVFWSVICSYISQKPVRFVRLADSILKETQRACLKV